MNLQVNVSCFTTLKMMLHAVVIVCCFLASCSYITVCSGLNVIDLFLIFDDCFFFTILLIFFTFIVGLFFVFVVVVMSWFCRFLSHSIILTTFLFCCRCFNIFSRFLVLILYNNFKGVFRRMLFFIYVSFYAVMCSVVILVISHICNLNISI